MEMSTDQMKIEIGSVIGGQYEIREFIGSGAMGRVYRAVDRVKRRSGANPASCDVAIKVLSDQLSTDAGAADFLIHECTKAQSLSHPNIVNVHHCAPFGRSVYLVMEFLRGRSIDTLVKDPDFAGLPLAEVKRIVEPAARGLQYAHECDVIHCDIKPSNIFESDDGKIKIIDFGIARAAWRPEDDATLSMTRTEIRTAYTPKYASPERRDEDHKPTPRDDVFSLACVIYQLLEGMAPFRMDTREARELDVKVTRKPRQLSNRQWKVLRRALSFDPAERPPSIEVLVDGVFTKPRFPWAAVGGAAAVALLGVGYWQAHPRINALLGGYYAQWSYERLLPAWDAVDAVIGGTQCAFVKPILKPEAVSVAGVVGDRSALADLRSRLGAVPKVETVDLGGIEIVDATFCAVLATFGHGVASRSAGETDISVDFPTADRTFAAGDALQFAVRLPPDHSFLYVDRFLPHGYVMHLQPSDQIFSALLAPERWEPDGSIRFGYGGVSGSWLVTAGFGRELITLVSSSTPLFDGDDDATRMEPTEMYLRRLGAAFARRMANAEEPPLGVRVLAVTTAER